MEAWGGFFMINVEFTGLENSELASAEIDGGLIESSASAVLENEGILDGELTVLVTVDEQMENLNREYRGIDSTTDVLAFPAGYTDPDTSSLYLGDVLISFPRAVEQAAAGGHPVAFEIQLLTVHGVLHLLGYDDEEENEKERMWAAQSRILSQLKNPLSPP
jgi:probable rRNA maturation factor